jgi:DNA (cytosine-5)-methyltransferase 1
LLTWYRAGFPVKTYQLREKAQDLTENDQDCGEKWRGWSAKYDQVTSSWKTAQLSLLGDSEPSSVIFPRSGMTRNGLLWELPMLERPTNETGSGYWPTPTVCGNYNRKGASKTSGDGLATAVRMWPTPTAHNAKETNAPSESARNTPTLAAQAGGPLNPDWVEWLMGWPIGHTALKPSETDKYRNAEQQHGNTLVDLEEDDATSRED